MRQTEAIEVPEPDEYAHLMPHSPEAEVFLDGLKPRRYAAIARTTDEILALALQDNWMAPATTGEEPWQRLRTGTVDACQAAILARRSNQNFETARTLQNIAWHVGGLILGSQYLDLENLLSSGAVTAANSMTTLLRNVPRIVKLHEVQTEQTPASIARQSVGLPWRLAMSSINQLLGAHEALKETPETHNWTDVDVRLDALQFAVARHEDDSISLRYADLDGLALPADGTSLLRELSIAPGTLFKDIPNANGPIIGCPITLLQRRLHDMWERSIEVAEAEQLWTNDSAFCAD